MLKRLRARLTYANVVSTLCLFVLLSGTAVAATVISGASIVDGTIAGSKLKNNTITSAKIKSGSLLKKAFKAGQLPAGPPGPAGAPGASGAAGPAGPAGSGRAYGFVDNSSGSPVMLKGHGGVSVRRSGNGIFCISTNPGIDPGATPIVAVPSAKSVEYGLVFVGSGLAYSQQCTGSEFQVLTVWPGDFNVGLNDVSFEFIIP
jgi:hypothetical protein